jgi:hypothetical protein
MRLAPGTVALDVDHYDTKAGADTLCDLERDLGELPKSFRVTARGFEDLGGKSLYQVPDNWVGRDPGKDIELLRSGHRFIAMGTHRKTGNPVMIYDDRTGGEVPLDQVTLDQVPELPQKWLDCLSRPASPELAPVDCDDRDRAEVEAYRAQVPDRSLGTRNELLNHAVQLLSGGFTEAEVQADLPRVALALDEARPWEPQHFAGMTDASQHRRAEKDRAQRHAERGYETVASPEVSAGQPSPSDLRGMPCRLIEDWSQQPDPSPATLLDVGFGPIVRPATLGTVHAPEKQGKSWTVIVWAVLEALRGRRVLYVDYENGARRFARRVRAAAHCVDYSPGSEAAKTMAYLQDRIKYMPDPQGWISDDELAGYDLVFIDAAIDLVGNHTDQSHGIDTMNSAQAVNTVYRRLQGVARSTGACITLVDHSNASGETSGSRRKRGAIDWQAKVTKLGKYAQIEWEFDRDNDGDDLPAVFLIFDGYRLTSQPPRSDTPPSLQDFMNANRLSEEQTARYRQIVMAVARTPGKARAAYRAVGHQARDIDALVALSVLALDGDNHVQRHPAMAGEWRWWWESALADAAEVDSSV